MAFLLRIGTISDILALRGWTRKLLLKFVVATKLLGFLDTRGIVLRNVDMLRQGEAYEMWLVRRLKAGRVVLGKPRPSPLPRY